jgi:hypothetical protein
MYERFVAAVYSQWCPKCRLESAAAERRQSLATGASPWKSFPLGLGIPGYLNPTLARGATIYRRYAAFIGCLRRPVFP